MAATQSIKMPPRPTGVARAAPIALVFGGAAALVGSYVYTQLKKESSALDRSFAQYKSVDSEHSRKRSFDGAVEDPRKSFYNVLSW